MYRLILIMAIALLTQCDKHELPPIPTQTQIPTTLTTETSFSGENCMYHVSQIVAIGERAPATPGYEKQLQYLQSQLTQYGWSYERQSFETNTPNGTLTFTNLRARFGKTPNFSKSAHGIISCHIDTKTGIPNFTGANDGASGAATILELARILATQPNKATQIELVFFDGEECFGEFMSEDDGLFGSKYYVSQLTQPYPSWQINLDMVGRQGKKIRIPPGTSPRLFKAYTKAVDELKLGYTEWSVARAGIIDDHLPFLDAGIDAINLIDDFQSGTWWHTAADNIHILDAKSFLSTGKMVGHLLEQLLSPQTTK